MVCVAACFSVIFILKTQVFRNLPYKKAFFEQKDLKKAYLI
jgi:hypothetical protein